MIKLCYGERVKTIGLVENISDSFFASVSSGDPISAVMLDMNEKGIESGAVSSLSRYKLEILVITATSSLQFETIVVGIKKSRWWNHMAQLLIFDPSGKVQCSEAYDFLWIAWTMDVLGAKFICNREDDELLIYRFNPYTESAPSPWKVQRIYKGVNNHPWALLVRKFQANVEICENMDFDPTKDCGGYKIRMTMSAAHKLRKQSKTNRFSKIPITDKFLSLMSEHMKVTFNFSHCPLNETLGFVDEKGEGHGMLANLINGRSDMLYRISIRPSMTGVPWCYPNWIERYFAVTQHTGYPSQLEKIISAIDLNSRIGLCLVIFVNVIFFKYAMHQSFMIAVLNALRLICNSCMPRLPNELGPRINLACFLFFIVIIQALFQGQLSALLTKHVRYPNINNWQDLINSDYIVFTRFNVSGFFNDPAFKGRHVEINEYTDKCTDYVSKNSSIACVSSEENVIAGAIDSKLHMSRNSMLEIPMSMALRNDWPLEERFNRHNFRISESGFRNYLSETLYSNDYGTLDLIENEGSGEGCKVLFLKDLDFAFVLLAIGLGCASIAFVVESFIGRVLSARVRVD